MRYAVSFIQLDFIPNIHIHFTKSISGNFSHFGPNKSTQGNETILSFIQTLTCDSFTETEEAGKRSKHSYNRKSATPIVAS